LSLCPFFKRPSRLQPPRTKHIFWAECLIVPVVFVAGPASPSPQPPSVFFAPQGTRLRLPLSRSLAALSKLNCHKGAPAPICEVIFAFFFQPCIWYGSSCATNSIGEIFQVPVDLSLLRIACLAPPCGPSGIILPSFPVSFTGGYMSLEVVIGEVLTALPKTWTKRSWF